MTTCGHRVTNTTARGYLCTQYAEDGAATAAEYGAASVHDGAGGGDGNKTYHQSRIIPRYVQQAETRTTSKKVLKLQGAESARARDGADFNQPTGEHASAGLFHAKDTSEDFVEDAAGQGTCVSEGWR